MARDIILFTTGETGGGKTWRRGPHFLIEEYLPNHEGVHYSNFPLMREKIAEVVARDTGGDVDTIRERMQIIPADVLQDWRSEKSGPWDYFADVDLRQAHIAIDEVHNFISTGSSSEHKRRWEEWLGEVRHQSCTVELLSQHEMKVAPAVRRAATKLLFIESREAYRDPFFKIENRDWYELRGFFYGRKYVAAVQETEEKNTHGGKKNVMVRRIFWRDPRYFKYYDSYSRPHGGGVKGQAEKHVCETRTLFGVLSWFMLRHWFPVGWRVALVLALGVFLMSGGIGKLIVGMAGRVREAVAVQGEAISMHDEGQGATVQRRHQSGMLVATVGEGVHVHPNGDLIEVTPEMYQDAVNEVQQFRERVAVMQAEIDRLRLGAITQGVVVMIAGDRVTFSNGLTYEKGETLDFEPYTGLSILGVDPAARVVQLSDGYRLRLGRSLPADGGGLFDRQHAVTGPVINARRVPRPVRQAIQNRTGNGRTD